MEGCVISILRGYTYEQVKAVCDTLCQSSKVKNVEITLNTENALEIISRITKEYGHCLHIGAGTVVTHDEVKAAIAAGAEFVLSLFPPPLHLMKFIPSFSLAPILSRFSQPMS